MKLSILTVLAAAMLASASVIPCDHHAPADITDSDFTVSITKDFCYKFCANRPLICGEGWYTKKIGDCWTCCEKSRETEVEVEVEELFEFEDLLD